MKHTLLIFPLWLGALLLWSLGIYILAQKKKNPEFRAFALATIAGGLYCGGYAGELSSPDIANMFFWSKVQYVGVATMPYFWIHFVVNYTGRKDLFKPLLRFIVAVIPIVTITFKLFDENLHFIYKTAAIDTAYNTFRIDPGFWYYIGLGYAYACCLTGMGMLAGFGMKRMGLYRKNAYLLILITLMPLACDIVYTSNDSPFGNLDITPYGMLVSIFLMYFAILKNDLVNLSPIARDYIFEHLPLSVLTFDNDRKLCEANETARALLALGPDCIGRNVNEIFTEYLAAKMLPESGRTQFATSFNGRDFDVNTYIFDRSGNKRAGWVVTLVDVSDHKRAEIRLAQMIGQDGRATPKTDK